MHIAARLVRAAQDAYARKWSFLALSLCALVLSAYVLGLLGLLPDPPAQSAPVTVATTSPLAAAASGVSPGVAEDPVKLEIPAIGLTTTIANPTTTNLEALDQLLLSGAVRYPTSAQLNEDGNVVIFGHSSYLPIVRNQAYKTFDGIQKLHAGDTVTVYSSDLAYTYAVRSVVEENATEAAIPLSVSGKVLTLSTCDVFGQKSDRFIVTADFVSSHSITTS